MVWAAAAALARLTISAWAGEIAPVLLSACSFALVASGCGVPDTGGAKAAIADAVIRTKLEKIVTGFFMALTCTDRHSRSLPQVWPTESGPYSS